MIDIKILANTFFIKNPKKNVSLPRCLLATLSIVTISIVMLSVTGCGQKGNLYLVDASSKTVANSSEALDSGSTPQDVAFDKIDDDEYQRQRYIEQQQMLDDINNDPNDY